MDDGVAAEGPGAARASRRGRRGRGNKNASGGNSLGDAVQEVEEGGGQGGAPDRTGREVLAHAATAAAADAATPSPAAELAPQPQAQAPAKRMPGAVQGLFGAAMRDIKKVKPTGAKLGAGKVEGRKEEGQE